MAVRVLFAVDYNHKPFCMVRAGDFRSAVKNASGFLAMPLNGQAGYRDPTRRRQLSWPVERQL